jgi:hypothetical protein
MGRHPEDLAQAPHQCRTQTRWISSGKYGAGACLLRDQPGEPPGLFPFADSPPCSVAAVSQRMPLPQNFPVWRVRPCRGAQSAGKTRGGSTGAMPPLCLPRRQCELSHSRAPPPGQVGTPRICRPPLNGPRASSQNDQQRMEGVRALAQRQAVQLERLVALAQVRAPHFRSRATAMHSIGDPRAVSPLLFIDASMSWARPPLDADT